MKWQEVIKELNISRPKFTKLKNELFKEKYKTDYSQEDIDKIKNILYPNKEIEEIQKFIPKGKQEPVKLLIDDAGENEYYARLIKDGKDWSVGVYSSTNLSEDVLRFKQKGMELKVIDKDEAQKIYEKLYL